MKLLGSGVAATPLSAFDEALKHITGASFIHAKIESFESDEHVRMQAALRHALTVDAAEHDCIIVTCSVGESSGSKRKLIADDDTATVTWTVVDTKSPGEEDSAQTLQSLTPA